MVKLKEQLEELVGTSLDDNVDIDVLNDQIDKTCEKVNEYLMVSEDQLKRIQYYCRRIEKLSPEDRPQVILRISKIAKCLLNFIK